jgi:MoaA/NifB/PqqE/SkfB family radical SAM enzyme
VRSVRITVFRQDDPLYRFCNRRGAGGRQPVPWPELVTQLEGLRDDTSITFAGSDPLEHPDFVRLLEQCPPRPRGHTRVLTDGFGLARSATIELLERCGVDEVQVVMPTVDAGLWGKLMRSLVRFEACARGLENAARSNLSTYVVIPLLRLRPNLEHLDDLLDRLDDLPVRGVLVALPELERVPPPLHHLLLGYPEASAAMSRVFERTRAKRREIGVFERQPIPPCAADRQLDRYGDLFNQRLEHLSARGAKGLRRVEACAECELSPSCPGIDDAYVRSRGDGGLRPITVAEANGWYTKPINRLEEIPYTRVSSFDSLRSGDSQRSGKRGLLRINGHCNMGCSFCFVDLSHPNVPEQRLMAEVDRLVRGGVTHLVLSGGEPSLHPALPQLIEHARVLGMAEVEVQTNGVKFARREYTERVVRAGLTTACVSLHSSDAAESDAITKQPEAFGKTVQAIHTFRELGVWTRVSHVINKLNYKDVLRFVRWLRAEYPDGMLDICFARAQEISSQTSPWILPSFAEIKPHVKEALDYCLDHDIAFSGLIGQGGYPPCMLDGDLRYYENAMDQIHRDAGGSSDFVKADRCSGCSFDENCVGVRRAYVRRHGDGEMRPF